MTSTFHYTVEELIPFIDWGYFFHAWQTKADSTEGMKLKADALQILQSRSSTIGASACYRELKVVSKDDDLIVYLEMQPCGCCPSRTLRIPFLRQQSPSLSTDDGGYTLCLADFVSPFGDVIGFFATTSSLQADDQADPYLKLLYDTLASRLAEAAAEKLDHDIHGIPQGESLIGIRPAVGYPSIPDLSVIFLLDQLIDMQSIGITLTDHGAMRPQSSVAGLMIPHPFARYFSVGTITEEQFIDYAHRRGFTPDEMRPFLRSVLP